MPDESQRTVSTGIYSLAPISSNNTLSPDPVCKVPLISISVSPVFSRFSLLLPCLQAKAVNSIRVRKKYTECLVMRKILL